MITDCPRRFVDVAARLPVDAAAACPRSVFLVAPEGFSVAAESAADNVYMQLGAADPAQALAQHRRLAGALAADCPAVVFPGDPSTPDAVFPNNVHATARVDGQLRLVVGHMRHPGRRREAERPDIRGFFLDTLGCELHDLRRQPGICELTGSMVVDRARGIGYCGLSERCDRVGAEAMFRAFGLRAMLVFDLAPGEYHANVVMSVLAGRALVVAPDGFADPAVPEAIAGLYGQALVLDGAQRAAFAGNCIAVGPRRAWFSQRAADSLRSADAAVLERAGFAIGAVGLDEVEKSGGSLRCCVGEIY